MIVLLAAPFLQALAMLFDEGWFHRKRGLPRWERIGHPLDTLTAAACYGWLVAVRPDRPYALPVYVALAAFSCLFITKDEFVHAEVCEPEENWLHSILFVLHPIVFVAFGFIWWSGTHPWILQGELLLSLVFFSYQVVYWSVIWKPINVIRKPHVTSEASRLRALSTLNKLAAIHRPSTTRSTTHSADDGTRPMTIP